jgi:hypothetical protein
LASTKKGLFSSKRHSTLVVEGVRADQVILAAHEKRRIMREYAASVTNILSTRPKTDLGHVATAALTQMILGDLDRLSGSYLLATDGVLHGYADVDGVDWLGLWCTADWHREGVPQMNDGPYWTWTPAPIWGLRGMAPRSVLAFGGTDLRRRIAADPGTDASTLKMMAKDSDLRVRDVAASNLAGR